MTRPYQSVFVNNRAYRVELPFSNAGKTKIDGREVRCEWNMTTDGHCTILVDNFVYAVLVEDTENDTIVRIAPYSFRTAIDDARVSRLGKGPHLSVDRGGEHTISAPMPGLILKVEVHENEKVKPGQGLIVMEAMKMENEIRSSVHGVVTGVMVKESMSVEKNSALLKIKATAD